MVQVPTRFSFDFVQIFSFLFKDLQMSVVENSNIFLFFYYADKEQQENNESYCMDSNINNEIRICLIAAFQYKLFIKLAQKKDSKQRIGYGCIYHFFSLEFLYADTDSAESKIDKPIVAIIRMISIWSMRFHSNNLIGRIQLFWNSTYSRVKDNNFL